jgi:hypothetical protein
LSCCFRPAAAENFAARLAAIWIVSPVAGLRPSRGALAGDRVEDGVDGALGLLAGQARGGDLLGELVLGHALLLRGGSHGRAR